MAHEYFSVPPHFRPYRWAGVEFQVGLQPIAFADWLMIDENYQEFMPRKRAHLDAATDRFYKALPRSRAAQDELRDLAVEHLCTDHPGLFSHVGRTLSCSIDSRNWNLDDESVDPLWQLSDIIQLC